MSFDEVDIEAVNTIRALSIDMIENAKSGHPGFPLGASPMLYVLYKNHMKINPKIPNWINRDRFVLSPGHGSSMLYALLHLLGFNISLKDLKEFRKLNSKTPGHPELSVDGVDAATGPLGQGLGMAVGMAMAEKHLSTIYDKEDFTVIDNNVYAIVSDGDLMEGISHESASLAGHLKLDNLVVMYDSNGVTLDANANKTVNDNVKQRFEAYGWNYIRVNDGNNLKDIDDALSKAEGFVGKPTIIEVKTVLGYGSPYAGKNTVHGNPLTSDECKETKDNLGYDEEPFVVSDKVKERFKIITKKGTHQYNEWMSLMDKYKITYPKLYEEMIENFNGSFKVHKNVEASIGEKEATRNTVHRLMQETLNEKINFWGGSADLSSSNKTYFENDERFGPENYQNNNIYYGVREFAEAAAANGITLYGGSKTFTSTFFVFSDYMRNAMRMAALQDIPTLFTFSHDSIALGQDGPTHQPIEQLDSIRAIPNLTLFRPADAVETRIIWNYVLNNQRGPIVLAMSRQNLPVLEGTLQYGTEGVLKGGYIVSPAKSNKSQTGVLIATGSEVKLALEVQSLLGLKGYNVAVVSMPSTDLFDKQSKEYKEKVLPANIKNRMSIELGSTLSWYKYTGLNGLNIGIDHFGASGDANQMMKEYGFDARQIAKKYIDKFSN